MKKIILLLFLFGISFFPTTAHATGVGGVDCATVKNVSLFGTLVGGVYEIADDTVTGRSTTEIDEALQSTLCSPAPRIRIPGLSFTSAEDLANSTFFGEDGNLYMQVPFLGEYIAAVYRYSVIVVSVIAVLMIIVSSILWISSAGNPERISEAKKRMGQALIALLLIATSFVILYTINPDLTAIRPLSVQIIEQRIVEYDGIYPVDPGVTKGNGSIPDGFTPPADAIAASFGWSDNPMEALIGRLPSPYATCSPEAAQWAAEELYKRTICTGPCHCNYAARHFLTYIGCSDVPQEGSANGMKDNAISAGWREVNISDITDEDSVGLLWVDGHVGVYLGKDSRGIQVQFDSAARKPTDPDWQLITEGSCPASGKFYDLDPADDENNCHVCSDIPAEAPVTGRWGAASMTNLGLGKVIGANGGNTCATIQIWTKRELEKRLWKKLYVPENAVPQTN